MSAFRIDWHPWDMDPSKGKLFPAQQVLHDCSRMRPSQSDRPSLQSPHPNYAQGTKIHCTVGGGLLGKIGGRKIGGHGHLRYGRFLIGEDADPDKG